MYEYRVLEIIKIVDGDTLDAKISLGFGINVSFRFRLFGVDTSEVYGPNASEEGKAAKAFVEQWFKTHSNDLLTVRTFKSSDATVGIGDGAFGRWLGAFFAHDKENSKYFDLCLELLEAGHAK